MPIPQLSSEQLSQARQKATEARRARATFKKRISTGELSLSQALEIAMADTTLAHIKVTDLLISIPRVGEKRVEDMMERHHIARSRRIQGLGPRQIEGLKSEFA